MSTRVRRGPRRLRQAVDPVFRSPSMSGSTLARWAPTPSSAPARTDHQAGHGSPGEAERHERRELPEPDHTGHPGEDRGLQAQDVRPRRGHPEQMFETTQARARSPATTAQGGQGQPSAPTPKALVVDKSGNSRFFRYSPAPDPARVHGVVAPADRQLLRSARRPPRPAPGPDPGRIPPRAPSRER